MILLVILLVVAAFMCVLYDMRRGGQRAATKRAPGRTNGAHSSASRSAHPAARKRGSGR
jgi:hypothetical protein